MGADAAGGVARQNLGAVSIIPNGIGTVMLQECENRRKTGQCRRNFVLMLCGLNELFCYLPLVFSFYAHDQLVTGHLEHSTPLEKYLLLQPATQ